MTKLYCVQFDGCIWHVEAESFSSAIQKWRDHVKKEWGEDYNDGDDPDSVAVMNDSPVIR